MNRNACFVSGFALGAAVMYAFDPQGGRRRRALVRDQMTHFARTTGDTVEAKARHWSNKAAGAAAEVQGVFRSAGDRPDEAATF